VKEASCVEWRNCGEVHMKILLEFVNALLES